MFDNVTRALDLTEHELVIRVTCGMIAALLVGRFGIATRHPKGNGTDDDNSAYFPTAGQIYRNAEQVWHRYYGSQDQLTGTAANSADIDWSSPIELFTHLLVDGSHVVRIIENVHVGGDLMRDQVTIEISLADVGQLPGQQRWVIPVLHRKQHALECFEVRNGADEKLNRLPQHLTDGLLAWSIEGMFRLAYVESPDRPEVELTASQKSALFRLIALVCQPDAVEQDVFAAGYETALGGLTPRVGEHAGALRDLCMYFAVNTVSAVEVGADRDDLIYVSYTDDRTNDRLGTPNDRHRTRLGIRPYRYRIPIYLAYSARTYDLRVSGPDGHFVYRHYLTPHGSSARELSAAEVAGHAEGALLMTRNEGVPHTGLQLRGMTKTKAADIECVVEFEEIPPGALRRTAVISAVCSLLMIAFAVSMPHTVDGNGGTDLAAFLLASPLFAATWVGQSSDKVQQSSLTTFGGLLVSALLSLVSSVLYVMQSLTWETATTIRLSVFHYVALPRLDAVWLALCAASLATTAYLWFQSSRRMSRYIRTLKRRRGGTAVHAAVSAG